MWLIYAEYMTSVFWAYAMATVLLIWAIGLFVEMPLRWQITIIPGWHGVLIGTTCLLQIMVSMLLDRRYDHRIFRHYFWMIWYPLAYWMLNMCTTIWAVPKVFARKRGKRAVWISPDRGLRTPTTIMPIESNSIMPSAISKSETETEKEAGC